MKLMKKVYRRAEIGCKWHLNREEIIEDKQEIKEIQEILDKPEIVRNRALIATVEPSESKVSYLRDYGNYDEEEIITLID